MGKAQITSTKEDYIVTNQYKKPWGWETLLIIAAILATIVGVAYMVNGASAQTVVQPDVVAVVETNQTTEWIDSLFKVLIAGLGLFLTFAIRTAVTSLAAALPTMMGEYLRLWMDDKRQRDLTSAITSAVSGLIKDGKWTGSAKDVIEDIKRNILDSTPQAAKHAGITMRPNDTLDAVLANIADKQSVDIQKKISETINNVALAKKTIEQVSPGVIDDDLSRQLNRIIKTVQH